MKPYVTVVVVNWNTRELLRSCVESIIAGIQGLSAEVIVVDNASADGSADMVRADFPSVRIVEPNCNLGFGGGVEVALAYAKGKYLVVTNADVEFMPGSLGELAGFLDERPMVGWVGLRIVLPSGEEQSGPFDLPRWWSSVSYVPILARLGAGSRSRSACDAPARCEWTFGACMAFRSRALGEVGGFPTGSFLYGEELALGARMRRAGWQVWLDPRATVIHAHRASTDQMWTGERTWVETREGSLSALGEVLPPWQLVLYDLIALVGLGLQFVTRRPARQRHSELETYRRLVRAHWRSVCSVRPRV